MRKNKKDCNNNTENEISLELRAKYKDILKENGYISEYEDTVDDDKESIHKEPTKKD